MSVSARDIYNNLHKVPLLPLLAVSVMVFSLFVTTNLSRSQRNLTSKAAPVGGDLFFASQQLNLQPNSTGVYDIYVTTKNGNKISAVDFTVSLDSSVASITNVSLNGVFPIQLLKDVTSSSAHVIAGVDPSSAFEGTGVVARVTLATGSAAGSANLSFSSNTQLSAVGIPANALGSTANSIITVGSVVATLTPTVAITSTPIPSTCSGTCVSTRTTCANVDQNAQCGARSKCCLD